MFLRFKTRFKDGKPHRYWSIVANCRTADQRVVQRQVLDLGEINDTPQAAWCQTLAAFQEGDSQARQIALFPADRAAPERACEVVQLRLNALQRHRPRQGGACWLACQGWDEFQLDQYGADKLPPSRPGTRGLNLFKTLVCYRWLDPGSAWRLQRHWYAPSAMADRLGEEAGLSQRDKLYRWLDKLLAHKHGVFTFLHHRWQALFAPRFDGLLYDLTRTYFEADPPPEGKRQFGYSRDQRSDGVQVVIALMVTPEGFPVADEVMAGNTSDKTTRAEFLRKIETPYGQSERIWRMDRGLPTEETLATRRQAQPPLDEVVGTPTGRLSQWEQAVVSKPWEQGGESVTVKLLPPDGERYLLAKRTPRAATERARRRRRLKKRWRRLPDLQQQAPRRDPLLLNLGAAQKEAGRVYGLLEIQVPKAAQTVTPDTFTLRLRTDNLRRRRRREGHYRRRSNLSAAEPAPLWPYYLQLTEVEPAFKELKGDRAIRPIYHQKETRIEAHRFLAFLAYGLQVTLKQRLRALAPGLTPRAVLDQLAAIQRVDVHRPTTEGRYLVLPRYTPPDRDQPLVLQPLQLKLPAQPPPRMTSKALRAA